jgi:hypothetical protein
LRDLVTALSLTLTYHSVFLDDFQISDLVTHCTLIAASAGTQDSPPSTPVRGGHYLGPESSFCFLLFAAISPGQQPCLLFCILSWSSIAAYFCCDDPGRMTPGNACIYAVVTVPYP